MHNTIPNKVVRKIITDILIERSNIEMETANELQEKEMKDLGVILNYSSEIKCTSAGTRIIADEISEGTISVEEAIMEILTKEEREESKNRCIEWIKENQKNKIEKDEYNR